MQAAPLNLPDPPYYIVTFTSKRSEGDNGYGDMDALMSAIAVQQPGYLGVESIRRADGFGLTNSFWRDEQSILQWKQQADHLMAQRKGRTDWYEFYNVRVGRIERAYGFDREKAHHD